MESFVLMADPAVAAVPVEECGEPLVSLREARGVLLDRRKEDDADAFCHLRAGVRARLLAALNALPDGLRFLVIEGYRPPARQQLYFDRYAGRLRAEHPEWDGGQIRTAASRFVSPPEVAPHSAGAAVDLTLVDGEGRELDMGTPVDATPEASEGACCTAAPNISAEARANRRTLSAALGGAGLVNYPTEWWHWSYGDRYWALSESRPAALYGAVAL